jgi:hypothetical protein
LPPVSGIAPHWAIITRYKRTYKVLLLLFGRFGLMWSIGQGEHSGDRIVAAFLGTVVTISFSVKMSNAGLDRPMQALVIFCMGI